GNIPWISSSDLFDNDIRTISINRHITNDAILNSSAKLCPKSTICIVSRVGVGKVAVSKCEICTSQDFMNIIEYDGNKYFLAQLIQIIIKSTQLQGTSIKGITSKEINNFKLQIPTISEQDKIMQFLELIEDRIQTQSKIIDDYLYLKESIIQHIFNNNYHSVPLNDLIKESSLRNKNLSFNNILSVNNSLGFIKQTEQFEERKVASTNTSNYKIVKKNQYAYNPARINVGSIARLKNFDIGIVSPMYIIFELNTTRITYTYFDIFLQSTTFKKQLLKKLEGSVRQCLTFSGMQNMSIELPSIDVQIQLSKKIKNIDLKILIEKKYLEQLRNQKKYLLRNMFI
ncbi:hypothetical protein FMM66_00005, partial [[Clostridium] cocleatum]